MWVQALPPEHLKQAIRQFVHEGPVSFVQLGRVLPQLRGEHDLTVCSGFILWRGLSAEGIDAMQSLHAESAIFFWLCSPEVYVKTGDAPFLQLMTHGRRKGEHPWLPTLIFDRAPTTEESRAAVKEYVSEIARYAMPRG